MNRRGIGRHQHVELAEAVDEIAPLEARGQLARLGVHIHDRADIAVVDLLVVVVLDLHDLVAWREGPAEALDLAFAGRVERGLELDVERAGAGGAPVHRVQHLDVLHGVEPEPLRDAGLHQLHDPGGRRLGILRRHEVEVAVALRP